MSGTVVDMEAIERQKENIQPLPQGRSAASLVEGFRVSNDLKAQERDFEQRLAAVTGEEDDPLEPFVTYVSWVQNAYPSGGKSGPLMKTVEQCVRRFKNDVRYRNDPRFLKLWLLVAHQAREPLDVFKYLSVNKIGSELALYYEEYAKYLEKSSR